MASTLNVTKTLTNEGWAISAYISPGGTIPEEIFVYENTGTTTLGPYHSVINISDFSRLQIWTGIAIANFGNKFVRHDEANFLVPIEINPDTVINTLKNSVQIFSTQYQAVSPVSNVFTIT